MTGTARKNETPTTAPTRIDLNKLDDLVDAAKGRLIAAVATFFPEGAPVRVRWGSGWMWATVRCASIAAGQVIVVSASGGVHHKSFDDVFLESEPTP
jgi:hypothetical protein